MSQIPWDFRHGEFRIFGLLYFCVSFCSVQVYVKNPERGKRWEVYGQAAHDGARPDVLSRSLLLPEQRKSEPAHLLQAMASPRSPGSVATTVENPSWNPMNQVLDLEDEEEEFTAAAQKHDLRKLDSEKMDPQAPAVFTKFLGGVFLLTLCSFIIPIGDGCKDTPVKGQWPVDQVMFYVSVFPGVLVMCAWPKDGPSPSSSSHAHRRWVSRLSYAHDVVATAQFCRSQSARTS